MRVAALLLAAICLMPLCCAPGAELRLVEDFDAAWQEGRWRFSNGPEFPGAAGRFERSKEAAHAGGYGGRLSFDFTGGGAYVAAVLPLDKAPEIGALRLWIRKPRDNRLTFRYTDPTGQTVQKGFYAPEEEWADVQIDMSGWTGHWGGANDGIVHGPPTQIAILVENTGLKRGELLFDDVRLVEGKPVDALMPSEYITASFDAPEGWHSFSGGNAGTSKLDGRTWQLDFTRGADWLAIAPHDYSLLGTPQEIRIRVKGAAPGHPVRLRLATHFMTFERTLGEFAGEGDSEIVTPAPPGEGWKWFGGENDGKIHGPLRITGLLLDAAGKKDAAKLELLEIRVKAACPPQRACVLQAELRDGQFVATVRSLAPKPIEATLHCTIRDWSGKKIAERSPKITVPAGAEPVEVKLPVPGGEHSFLEAEFGLSAKDQMVPPTQAYSVAPIKPHGGPQLDPASPFGMGLYLYRYPGHAEGLKEMNRAAQVAQDAGVKWSREEFHWSRIQPERGKFDWSFYDALVATAKRHGISIYGILGYWSGWAKAYTPEGIEDYCRFAAAAAERYRDDVQHWEIWNEPNIFFWQGPRDLYADLLKQAYAAIKKANPNALVLGCSTAGIDHAFIKRMMDLGAPFDILTIHPYRSTLDDRGFVNDLKKVAELAKRPDGTLRQVWITEMGWATYVPHNSLGMDFQVTSQRRQAELIARAYIDSIASGVAPNISWYDFRNDGTDPLNFEHNMGIVTRDFRIKPAYRAYATVTRMLQGKPLVKQLVLGKEVIAFSFSSTEAARPVIAIWSTDADRSIELPAGKPMVLTDLMGGTQRIEPIDGKASVPLRFEVPAFLADAE